MNETTPTAISSERISSEQPKLEYQDSWYWNIGPLCLNVYMLAGRWISFGIHLSFIPLYIDLHIVWWVISIMSRSRGEWIREQEDAYTDAV